MLKQRNIILLVPILLFITFPLWKMPLAAFLSPRGAEEEAAEKDGKISHDFTMNQVKILQSQEGKKTAVILAQRAMTGGNDNEFYLEDVNADIFDQDNQKTKVIAETGLYNMDTEALVLKKNVIIKRITDNQTMYSNHVIYSDRDRTIISPGSTRFFGENFDVIGGRLDYSLETGKYLLSRRVHCIIGSSFNLPN
ncbi:MAG: LPS export ABC transporter periplasmic protein LptC [Deltaproteobacteria bacterium]|nr:MAG: LPS export ABC transporter periplasmic protein LptC [Deltaproteobacteria bacterium]